MLSPCHKNILLFLLLNGGRNPSLTFLKKIADALDVSLNYFFESSDDKKDVEILKLKNENLELKNRILELEKEILNLIKK